jgi:hypothetical protein
MSEDNQPNTDTPEEIIREDKRDNRGRFVNGAKPGPGRPRGNEWMRRLKCSATAEQWDKALSVLWDMAHAGDIKAATLLFRYLIPNPQAVSESVVGNFKDKLEILLTALTNGDIDASIAQAAMRLATAMEAVDAMDKEGKPLTAEDFFKLLSSESNSPRKKDDSYNLE